MDDLDDLRSLLDGYDAALEALGALRDPALEELVARVEIRRSIAQYAYDELLHPLGSSESIDVLRRTGRER